MPKDAAASVQCPVIKACQMQALYQDPVLQLTVPLAVFAGLSSAVFCDVAQCV